jgi:hypothetical protein
MQHSINLSTSAVTEPSDNQEVSFVKLHATLCFLMTQFHSHQCPKLKQFIVRHLSLMIEHPQVANSAEAKTLYLQLQQQWQTISPTVLQQVKSERKAATTLH